ncbi:MAG TPA: FKBP-type peptidyl-prolyl cis-trans isomerase [Cytophagales bacterium]|nr:FKBP-type peptidyl-prolyl cis-trans isomerase [Cytophagales bacterium]
MNFKVISVYLILFVFAVACTTSKKASTASASVPAQTLNSEIDSISYSMGISIAKNIKSQGLDSVNAEAFAKGLKDVFNNDSLLIDSEEGQNMLATYFQKIHNEKLEANASAGRKFLEENKTKEGVRTTESGLQYQVIKEGTGPTPVLSDRVKVHYHGTLIDGTVFDSSVDRGEPVTFAVNAVIPGWTEALQLMKVGSKYKVFIPSELAYGERGAPPVIGPNSTLIFDIELLGIEKEE